jgi:HAD superfamily hydrolase (TIGR01458 family)
VPDPARPLAGVRALLLDLDGVIVLAEKPIAGSARAIAQLAAREIPFRIVTNTSLVSRATLSRWGASMGAPIPPDWFQSALSVSAAYTARHYPDQPLYVLASDDALSEFAGQRLLSHDEAGKREARAAAVVVGDSPEAATWDNLNRAFRLIRNGAELIGMHKNRWWLTPDGPTIDSGAFVAGLEFATGAKARIVGKPAPEFFREAATQLATEARQRGGPALRRRDILMVGDDLETDIRAAQRAGLRGAFVLTGKHTRGDLEAAQKHRRNGPDLVAESLAEVVAALD